MPEITLQIDDEVFNKVTRVFGNGAVTFFSNIAINELTDWLSSEERPSSISELETRRIFQIYTHILPNILPTADSIGDLFNLPIGRARFITQNLNYRHPEYIKRCRIETIIAALNLNQTDEDNLPVAILPIECEEYMMGLANELYFNHAITTIPKKTKMSEKVMFVFGANDREPIFQHLNSDLASINE